VCARARSASGQMLITVHAGRYTAYRLGRLSRRLQRRNGPSSVQQQVVQAIKRLCESSPGTAARAHRWHLIPVATVGARTRQRLPQQHRQTRHTKTRGLMTRRKRSREKRPQSPPRPPPAAASSETAEDMHSLVCVCTGRGGGWGGGWGGLGCVGEL
jgi:hypothetical protein